MSITCAKPSARTTRLAGRRKDPSTQHEAGHRSISQHQHHHSDSPDARSSRRRLPLARPGGPVSHRAIGDERVGSRHRVLWSRPPPSLWSP